MKKLVKGLKWAGLIVLILIGFAFLGIKIFEYKSIPAKDYWRNIQTGGMIEAKYLQSGGYEVSYYEEKALQSFEKYEIWYPSELTTTQKIYPVIVICNGTGWKASKSDSVYAHYASWGFIVIGTEEEYSWNGFGAEMALRHLEKLNKFKLINDTENLFCGKIDFDHIGILGHSQGGVGVINAITATEHKHVYRAAIALSPANKDLAEALEWPYDAGKIQIPTMLISGEGGGDDWVVTGEGLQAIYQDVPADKVMMRRKNTAHGDTQMSEDGYVIAWFMYYLQGDEEAGKAFYGTDAEIWHNLLYQDIQVQKQDIQIK